MTGNDDDDDFLHERTILDTEEVTLIKYVPIF